MSGIVTPEAVPLDFADAGIGSRAAALLIDAVVVFTALVVVSLAATAAFSTAPVPGWVVVSSLLVLNFVLLFGYPVVCEVAFGGRSLGKLALGLRVVTVEGAPVGFRHAAIRSAFMLVDFLATGGAAAVVSAAVTRRSQRLGDLVAGTVVLRERHVAADQARAVTFAPPVGSEGYAATVSPTAVDAGTYERIRAFLLRADELTPEARSMVAVTLARPLLGRTPPPPTTMDPETYLRVLAAVHQRGHAPAEPARSLPSTGASLQQRPRVPEDVHTPTGSGVPTDFRAPTDFRPPE